MQPPLPYRMTMPGTLPWLTLGVSTALILGAHAFETFGGLLPCPLCMNQRGVHYVGIWAAVLALVNAGWLEEKIPPVGLVALLGLIYLASAGLAGYHVGVEYGWWEGPQACSGTAGGITIDEMLKSLGQEAAGPGCDEIPWSLFGISMAGYNALISLALAALCASSFHRGKT